MTNRLTEHSAPMSEPTRLLDTALTPSANTLELLRAAIRDHRDDAPEESRSGFCAALVQLTAEGREQRRSAVDVLLALKKLWPTLPEVQRLPRDAASLLLTKVVSLCIDEYYRPPRPAPLTMREGAKDAKDGDGEWRLRLEE
jgi:hypothetical protein